ncbi:MAG: VWA domain-containing protein [Nitrospiraceae bacterium]|nr:MAG: VWA domain-containing protein [Nitrospiraceae bacterium]
MNSNLKIIIVLLFTLLAYGGFDSTCLGADKDNIDVVLVMDSSGSMKETDPHSLRIPAAKLFISLLDNDDRAGIISFSDRGYPIAYLTPVDNDRNKDRLFRATERITSKGLFTNLYDAFNTGLEVLSQDRIDGRQRIIILMSDGMMDSGDPSEDITLVDKLQKELSETLEQEGIKVYTIAFTEQSDRRLLEKISKRTGGFYNLALTDRDFHVIFTSIFEGLKEPEMLPMEENGFLIDGSVEEVTIVATKTSPGTAIQINAPDGQEYNAGKRYSGLEWFVSDNFDMITVQRPASGRWEILYSTGENNKAYIITDLRLQTNFEQLYALFGENLDIQAWLEKEGKVLIEGEVLETTDVSMALKNPDGNLTSLKPFHKGDGIFRRSISPFTPGNYRFTVVAKGKTFEREKSFLFNVASLQESKEDIETMRAEAEYGKDLEQSPEDDGEQGKEGISWVKIAVQFVAINLLLAMVIFGYLKFGRHIRIKLKTLGRKDPEESGSKEDRGNQKKVTARDDLNIEDDDSGDTAGEEKEEKEHITLEDEEGKRDLKPALTVELSERDHSELEVKAEKEKSGNKSQISKEKLDQEQPESVEAEDINEGETEDVINKAGSTQISRSEVEDIDKLWEGALEEQQQQAESVEEKENVQAGALNEEGQNPVVQNNNDTTAEKSDNLDLGLQEHISNETENTSLSAEAAMENNSDDTLIQQSAAAVDGADNETDKDPVKPDTEGSDTIHGETLEEQKQEASLDHDQAEDMDDVWADALKEQASTEEQDKPEVTPAPQEENITEEPKNNSIVDEQDDMAQAWAEAMEEQKEDEEKDPQGHENNEQDYSNNDFLDFDLPEQIDPESADKKRDEGTGGTAGA